MGSPRYFHADEAKLEVLWDQLCHHPINMKAAAYCNGSLNECLHPQTLSVWQYMGSVQRNDSEYEYLEHEFRHRRHPAYERRVYATLLESQHDDEITFRVTKEHEVLLEELRDRKLSSAKGGAQ